MHPDFPAAHSMDTTWFAIDRDGRVASFTSHESGAVPFAALLAWRSGGPVDDAWQQLRDLDGRLYHYEHPERFDRPQRIPAGDLWLHNDGPRVSGPYVREEPPAEVPLHVDQLPPAAREFVSAVRFAGLSFAQDRAIQPAELAPCESEQSEYLTLAGERRPFPSSQPPQESQ
jgi:hypothetical protein